MLGAIIGDVAGSTYEVDEINMKKKGSKVSYEDRIKILDKTVPLFKDNSSLTDDSVLTCAIADDLINGASYEETLKSYGLRELSLGEDSYGRNRFGHGFISWLSDKNNCNSYGNGCAMRISPVATLLNDIKDIKRETYNATIPSHNCYESILCAQAVSMAIYMAKNKKSKEEIKKYIEENYFDLDFNLKDLQKNYCFTSKCTESVPQAIYAFLIADDFEDGIRKAISIGGDTDTIACIAGSILESYYGVPEELKEKVDKYIPHYLKDIVNSFYERKLNNEKCSRKVKTKK